MKHEFSCSNIFIEKSIQIETAPENVLKMIQIVLRLLNLIENLAIASQLMEIKPMLNKGEPLSPMLKVKPKWPKFIHSGALFSTKGCF